MINETSRFVLTIPLSVSAEEEAQVLSRLEAARQVYNACLGEAFRRLRLLRESRAYQKAVRMPKRTSEQKRARSKTFRDAERNAGLTHYDMYAYTKQFTRSWLNYHLDSQVNRKLAKRAIDAVNRYRFGIDKPCKHGQCTRPKRRKEGKCYLCGRPRFIPKHIVLTSLEGTNNVQSIHWTSDNVLVWTSSSRITLRLPGIVELDDPTVQHGLSCPIKFARLLRKEIRGRNCFYAQLVLEGAPLQRTDTRIGRVGLDIGPSTVAVVSETGVVKLFRFCDGLDDKHQEIRKLQRKLDRQRRANNPDMYNADGTIKPGRHRWKVSSRMAQTEVELRETHRQLAEQRKTMHGQIVNYICSLGNVVQMESLSYKAWQRNRHFAKSVQHHAPGAFVELLRRKVPTVIEFGTYHTRFSQTDHLTGEWHPEWSDLSVRHHTLYDGTYVQRDLYSAFLAMCYDAETDSLNVDYAREAWSGEGSHQQAAFRELLRENNG
jgi:putative transposase